MEIKVSIEELRKRSLFVATPMYGGNCTGMYSRSMAELAVLCAKYSVKMQLYYLFNESLITRARNYATDEFLRSDCTHMMFIDADIGFNANDVLGLLALSDHEDPDNEYDILAGPYPKKCISWEKIKMAVDKGVADENPNELEKYVGDYVFNPVQGQQSIAINKPVEVLEAGTGFMLIKRKTFERFAEGYGDILSYKPDHARTEHFDGSREIIAYFDTPIDKETRRYLSEDYMFCQWSRKLGMKVWLCPWIELKHIGMMIFGGSLADIARIGAAATVDPTKLKTKKKSDLL
jgi:hypothetical protein